MDKIGKDEVVVFLRPIVTGRSTYYTGKINFKDRQPMVITSTWKTYPGELRAGDEMLFIKFDQEKTFEKIVYRTGIGSSLEDKDKSDAVAQMCKHNITVVKYGPKNDNMTGEPMFTLEFQSERINSEAELMLKKYSIMNKVMALSPQEKADVAFRYGINAIGLTNMDLFVKLCDFNSGALMTDIIPDGEEMSAMDHFITHYDPTNLMEELKLAANKALNIGIITKNVNGFFLNKEHVGMNMANLLDYLNSNPTAYKYIKEEIAAKSLPVKDDMGENASPMVDTKKIVDEAIRFQRLKEFGKSIRAQGAHMTKDFNKLKESVINAQHVQAQLAMYNIPWNRKWNNHADAYETIKHKTIERQALGEEIYDPEKNDKIVVEW